MELHSWGITCPQCHKNSQVLDIKFSADGRLHIDCICVVCNIALVYDNSWEKIVISCWERDNQKTIVLPEVSGTLQ